MGGSCERIRVAFGTSVSAVRGAWGGIPGDAVFGGADILATAATVNAIEETWQPVPVPYRHSTAGPVLAIGIAPSSPIECVDLYIMSGGTNNVHRLSPGAPFVGTLSENDVVYVVPVRDLPLLTRYKPGGAQMNFAFFTACTVTHDMANAVIVVDKLGVTPTAGPQPVVDLNVYRGHVPPLVAARRAPYSGSLLWQVVDDGTGTPTIPGFFMITDGRRRVRVVAGKAVSAFGASVKVDGVEGYKSTIEPTGFAVSRLVDLPCLDPVIAAVALANDPKVPTIVDYAGNPYFAFLVTIQAGAIGAAGYINVHCWDE